VPKQPRTFPKRICNIHPMAYSGPSPGYSSRGGQKTEAGAHLKNTALDVCSNPGAKREMGGPGTTGPPAGDGPEHTARQCLTLFCIYVTRSEENNVCNVLPTWLKIERFFLH